MAAAAWAAACERYWASANRNATRHAAFELMFDISPARL
jgi:hypothetical protein